MKIWKNTLLWYLGGMTYATLELLWRGRTHGSMFALGGACFLLIGKLGQVKPPLPVPIRAVVSAGIVTMLELGCGLLVNRQYAVWDFLLPYAKRKAVKKTCRWHVFRPWEIPTTYRRTL